MRQELAACNQQVIGTCAVCELLPKISAVVWRAFCGRRLEAVNMKLVSNSFMAQLEQQECLLLVISSKVQEFLFCILLV